MLSCKMAYQITLECKKEVLGLKLQMVCAFGANLMYVCHGMIFAASGFLIPKLEDPIEGFGISVDEGSWVGKNNQTTSTGIINIG